MATGQDEEGAGRHPRYRRTGNEIPEYLNYFVNLAELNRRIDFELSIRNNAARPCPKCGEERQIQLRDAFDQGGVLWKCRMCKHKYHDQRKYPA